MISLDFFFGPLKKSQEEIILNLFLLFEFAKQVMFLVSFITTNCKMAALKIYVPYKKLLI